MKSKLDSILLVDDDKMTNFFNKKLISSLDVTEHVCAVESGSEALEYLKGVESGVNPHPHVIFLDINMPGMNGWEFLENYWELDLILNNDVHVIMLSTSEDPADIEKAELLFGVSKYFAKPLTEDKVRDVIKRFFHERM